MDWIKAVEAIWSSQQNNQLVIFVGAGVSANSGVPSWSELIKKIAIQVGYDKCRLCSQDITSCNLIQDNKQCSFSQEELLRVPEYFYQADTSTGHTTYYNFIRCALETDNGPNPIDDEIFNILPHHIITTNFDNLLESTNVVNSNLYAVVSQDSDLLSTASDRYLIKMHGDLDNVQSVVLRESDYIDYEQTHPLISTFIRSLLINHTFLFLGYSLNDYNLNLIIGWINYFRKHYAVNESPQNFLVTASAPESFEQIRLESKNIFTVDLSELPDSLVSDINTSSKLIYDTGKRLLSFLRCITDTTLVQEYISLEKVLPGKFQVLKSYNRISHEDLRRVLLLSKTRVIGTCMLFYVEKSYDQIAKIIQKNNPQLIELFQRTGITEIAYMGENPSKDIDIPTSEIQIPYMQLYLDNDYIEISSQINTCSDMSCVLYFYHLLNKSSEEIDAICFKEASSMTSQDYVAILLHKMRVRAAKITWWDRQNAKTKELRKLFKSIPTKYYDATHFLRLLYNSAAENMDKMKKILEKQEQRYAYLSTTWHSGSAHTHIWDLQGYIYDYYFFFKGNYLPLDYFSDSKEYFSHYIKAILCTYAPVLEQPDNNLIGISTERAPYPLNDIDLDIFVKYCDSKDFIRWIKEYHAQALLVEDGIDVVTKFKNLCASFEHFRVREWADQIHCFSIIVCMLELNCNERIDIFNGLVNTFVNMSIEHLGMGIELFVSITHLLEHLSLDMADAPCSKLLECILSPATWPELLKQHCNKVLNATKLLAPYAKQETIATIISIIDSESDIQVKVNRIFEFRHLISREQYRSFLANNLEYLNTGKIFYLLVEGNVDFDENIYTLFINTIQRQVHQRFDSRVRTFPDMLELTISHCIILKLCGFKVNLSRLEAFTEYSPHLRFVLDPDHFDYSTVDLTNYMWENLIYSNDYKKYFVEHKSELLSDDLRNAFKLGLDTQAQQKIVYGLLVDSNELRSFGR